MQREIKAGDTVAYWYVFDCLVVGVVKSVDAAAGKLLVAVPANSANRGWQSWIQRRHVAEIRS